MTLTSLFRIILLSLVLAPTALAQTPLSLFGDQDLPRSSADLVAVDVFVSQDGVEPGDEIQAAVMLGIESTWHVNAHQPLQDYLIGTNLDLETHPRIIIAETQYPEPKLQRFAFASDQLAVYEGQAPIFLTLRTSEAIEPGQYDLEGELRIQACNDEICLAPSTVEVSLTVPVVEAGTPVVLQHEAVFEQYDPFAVQSTVGNEIAARFEESWVLAFLSIFVIGLALNLTPCVYPMMSVTVSLFGGQEAGRFGSSFARATIYVLGIVFMYSVLGVMAAFTGSLFGAWLQSPWVLAAIGALLFLLSLSMFGVYELQLPSSWMTKLGSANQVTGFAGLFLSGMAVGVFAAPCIGPPIIALLAFVGAQGNVAFGFASFAVLAFGLGVPYLILGTFSGLLSNLPRSGVWMVWVKKVFGVVLVGAALFYLGLAFAPAIAPYAVVVALIGGGIYLGFLERSGNSGSGFQRLKWVIGTLAVASGIWAFVGLQKPGIQWEPYAETAVAEALEEGRPVLMDFYADWCIPCLELDRATFTDGRVIDATRDFTRLKVDLTHFDSEEAEALRNQYNVAGVPTIVFLDDRGNEVEEARVVGFVNARAFLERVDRLNRRLNREAVPASY